MPRAHPRCSVCGHPARDEIDRALVAGEGYRTLAQRYAPLGREAIRRHAAHLPETLARAHEAHEIARADGLLGEVQTLQARASALLTAAERVVRRAERTGDKRTVLRAIASAAPTLRELRSLAELLGKLAGQLQDGTTVTIALLPEWTALRGRILVALEPHPEAREAVIKALEADNAP